MEALSVAIKAASARLLVGPPAPRSRHKDMPVNGYMSELCTIFSEETRNSISIIHTGNAESTSKSVFLALEEMNVSPPLFRGTAPHVLLTELIPSCAK